ncbi:LysR family transcriptional regulator [Sandaracinobacter sp. RS1-74]|uniref:LysR family transcriptional regulator n=1 Tax=Sandaracinobacteroides sayramensis TaxID=2913411 RepID=UPI001EDB0D42|nr:LysR family transcriptional regulator [Sandaracinobacteroides sayramensis]MCG2841681.1 LysR family transcriptional regulator [Sandaracinobacteroides sayramensis]
MKRSLIPLNALRVFDAAARSLSFTKAADELAVTPAAVGQQIRALEETLGVILFRRTARGLELTPEAARALPHLRSGFTAFEETVSALREGQGATRLSLGCARGAIRHWLMPRLSRWLEANADASVQVLALDGPVDFSQANLDLALSYGPTPDAEGVFGRKLADELLVTVAVPGIEGRPLGWRSLEGPAVALPDAGAALDWALAGLGEAQVPLTLAADALEAGLLEERGERVPTDDAYWLCAPAPQWKSAKVKALVEQLLEAL